MLNSPHEYQKMYEVELSLWWYRILHQQVLNEIYMYAKDIAILDIGCGTGGLMNVLRNNGYTNIKGSDLSDDAINFCKQRNFEVTKSDLKEVQKVYEKESFDFIICNDALCYASALQRFATVQGFISLLKPGGKLVMNLPALSSFAGQHDVAVGLIDRVSLTDINAWFQPEQNYSVRFWPALLAPLIYAARLKQRLTFNQNSSDVVPSDVELPHPILNFIFYWLTRFELMFPPISNFASSAFITFKK